MAYSTVADVNARVQAYLNDSSATVWTAAVLLPLVKTAYADVTRRVSTDGYSRLRKIASPITVGPSVTTIPRTAAIPTTGDFTGSGLNDATFGGTWAGTAPATYEIEITTAGAPDVFKWRKTINGGTPGSYTTGVNVTGAAQALSSGVTVTFAATTGHTVGNVWLLTVAYYPSDMIRPLEVREVGTALALATPATYLTLMSKNSTNDQLPNMDTESLRQIWDWKNDSLYVRPGTLSSNITVLYETELNALTGDGSEIQLFNGLEAVSLVTAAHAAMAWNPGAASSFFSLGWAEADRLKAAEAASNIDKGHDTVWGYSTPVS